MLVPAVVVGVALARRRTAVAAVRPDLRSPWLYLPTYAPHRVGTRASAVGLRLARRLLARGTVPLPGVEVVRRASGSPTRGPGSRDVVLYEPAGRVRPSGALLWIHGGGMVQGDPRQDHDLCSLVATELGVLVVSAGYRLAPEHPFPAALDDVEGALRWLHREAATLGVDGDRVAVGGASAGGGLAACLAQRAHDAGLPVAFQVLEYPLLDDRSTRRSDHRGRGRIGWTPATNRFAWAAYLGQDDRPGEAPPGAAAARRRDLTGLAPAWIGVGDLDLLHDEAVEYARRLLGAGVACELHVEPGMFHAADVGSDAPSMQAFRRRMVDALREAVG